MEIRNERQGEGRDAGTKAITQPSVQCPACGKKGKAVKPITIESLVVEEARRRVGRSDGFRFCAETACDVAYFHPETGARIARDEVKVRIGQKETAAPRPVCYCFHHTVEEIEAEVAATGTSKVADDITDKCRQGLDRCEETNPQGACCLGNVRRAMKDAQERSASAPATVAAPGAAAESESCCAVGAAGVAETKARRPRNAGLWATSGAVVSAILSSACCWLPLLLIAFGASAAGVAGFFEAYRPVLLGATGVLLAGGFYLVYFRKEKCGPGEACAVPNPRLQRFNKIMLWAATAVVLAFSLFPRYVGYLLGNGDPHALAATPASGESRVFRIEGMTCEACTVTLREQLVKVPGVARAEVSFEAKTARVFFAAEDSAPSNEAVLAAIRQAGYSGTPVATNGTPVATNRTVHIAVSGITCAGCASSLQTRLQGIAGVGAARVDYESGRATVTITADSALDPVLEAIAQHGFKAAVLRERE
jgi:copper chaperone CopZ